MQTPIFLTKLSDESIIFISDVGKRSLYVLTISIINQTKKNTALS
jgi:hypothetical protein